MKLIIISLITRRDLHVPLKEFKKIEIYHLYKNAPYNDMSISEEKETPNIKSIKYTSGLDLFFKIKKIKPDIIQGIEPLTFPAGFFEYLNILIFKYFFKIPFFFPMLENRPIKEKFGKFIGFFLKIYLKIYSQSADFIIPLNKGSEKTLNEIKINKEKINKFLWACWGVDINEFLPNIINKKEDIKKILFVGRLDESKGIKYLLDSFKIISKKRQDIKLIIIGDGPLKNYINDFIKNEKNIEFKGIIKNKDLPYFFRQAYLTITPSITTKRWEEQVGMVNIQSMACGTPVISTLSGAIPEYVPNNKAGILVLEKDSNSLVNAILDLINNEEKRNEMSKFAREYVLEHYDQVKNIKKAEEIICYNKK